MGYYKSLILNCDKCFALFLQVVLAYILYYQSRHGNTEETALGKGPKTLTACGFIGESGALPEMRKFLKK